MTTNFFNFPQADNSFASLVQLVGEEEAPTVTTNSTSTSTSTTFTTAESEDALSNNNNSSDGSKVMVIFSGGTAFNTVAHELQQHLTRSVAHVLPVSDDGGSTAEIIRVLGGPAVGDIRSRCLRLSDDSTIEAKAVKRLLGHRLISSKTAPPQFTKFQIRHAAKLEWLAIVEGANDDNEGIENPYWSGISTAYKDTIRAFLVHFHVNVLMNSATTSFNFTGGSVGNFFFAGARLFFKSMSAAIFLYSRVSGIPHESQVLPAVVTEERLSIGAVLKDGTRIRGQNNISHPSPPQIADGGEGNGNSAVDKSCDQQLCTSPIERVTYLYHDKNQPTDDWDDQQQYFPETNPLVLEALDQAGCIIYGMGSLYTSIMPTLILDGVGQRIVAKDSHNCPKILLLNGWYDRETCWIGGINSNNENQVQGMDATMIVQAIVTALETSYVRSKQSTRLRRRNRNNSSSSLFSLTSTSSRSNLHHSNSGVNEETVAVALDGTTNSKIEKEEDLLVPLPMITDYVTHVLYPQGGEVRIDQQSLNRFCESRWSKHPNHSSNNNNKNEIETDSIAHTTNSYIRVLEVRSIPASECHDAKLSGGKSDHRVYDPKALVKTLHGLVDDTQLV